MTDNEIIKALEEELKTALVINHRFEESNDTENPDDHKFIALLSNTIKLINRQKAEIEWFADIGKMYSEIRAEAIKEFAERLKAKEAIHFCKCGEAFVYTDLFNSEIDDLVKESVGEE